MSGDKIEERLVGIIPMTDDDKAAELAYLERVERAARAYVDLTDQPSEGPGFMVVHRIEDALRALTLVVRQGVGP